MKVAIFGTRKLGYDGILRLINSRHDVVFVVHHDYEITEGYGNFEYAKLVTDNDIPFFFGEKLDEKAMEAFKRSEPDIGLSLYWKRLLKEEITSIPKYGFLNVHAGPLPLYRGFASSVWQMLDHRSIAECVIHKVVPGEADSGNIFDKVKATIGPETTIKTLSDELFEKAIQLLPNVLDRIENGKTIGVSQYEPSAMYSYPRLPQDGSIDWNKPAKEIDLLVRAVTKPYPGAFTYYQNGSVLTRLYIWKAHPVRHQFVGVPGHVVKNDKETGESWVLTGDGVLAIEEAQFEGEDSFKPGEVWKSVKMRLGLDAGKYLMDLQVGTGEEIYG